MNNRLGIIFTTIVALITVIGTVFGIGARYVATETFNVFKQGEEVQLGEILHRLDRIENKLDKLNR